MSQISMTTLGLYTNEKGDGCHENSMFGMGDLASKILDLFGKVEGNLYAHGMGASCVNVPI